MKQRRAQRGLRDAGFTLLEVLVATAILGTAVAALFSLLSGSLAGARRLAGPEQALLLARAQMEELLAASEQGRGAPPALPLEQKVRGRWNDRFRWEAQATRVPAPRPANPGEPVLVRIVFDAFWSEERGGSEKQLSLETYQIWQEPVRNSQ